MPGLATMQVGCFTVYQRIKPREKPTAQGVVLEVAQFGDERGPDVLGAVVKVRWGGTARDGITPNDGIISVVKLFPCLDQRQRRSLAAALGLQIRLRVLQQLRVDVVGSRRNGGARRKTRQHG